MRTVTAPPNKRRARHATQWIPDNIREATITKEEAYRFTEGLTKIAAKISGLPPDFSRNHDHYIHGSYKR